jgi:hypothetical protein
MKNYERITPILFVTLVAELLIGKTRPNMPELILKIPLADADKSVSVFIAKNN